MMIPNDQVGWKPGGGLWHQMMILFDQVEGESESSMA